MQTIFILPTRDFTDEVCRRLIHLANHSDLEAEVAQSTSQIVLDGDGLRLQKLRWVSSIQKGPQTAGFCTRPPVSRSHFAFLAGQIAESLRPFSKIFPFSGDCG
jgi:hypothetical protein